MEGPKFIPEQESTLPPHDLVESRMEKTENSIRNRHQTAVLALRFEEKVSEFAEGVAIANIPRRQAKKGLEEWVDTEFEHASPDLRSRYIEYAKNYFAAVDRATQLEQKLKKKCGVEEWDEDGRERAALNLFQLCTGSPPLGKVRFERKEGFLIIECENLIDSECLSHGSSLQGLESKAPAGGRFLTEMPTVGLGENAKQAMVVVSGISPRHRRSRRVLEHERQHFLNAVVFNKFQGLEQAPSEKTKHNHLMQAIKDEILAYTKDGSDMEHVKNILDDPLYEHLSKKLPAEEKDRARALLNEIANASRDVFPLFGTARERGVLVYQLLDIPLARFPEWIKKIGAFYQTRLSRDQFQGYRDLRWDTAEHDVEDDYIYPEEKYSTIAQKMRKGADDLEDMIGNTSPIVLLDEEIEKTDQRAQSIQRIQRLYNRCKKARQGLLRDDVHVPVILEQPTRYVRDKNLREQKEQRWTIGVQHHRRLRPVMKDILSEARDAQQQLARPLLDQIPQNHIDDAFAVLTQMETDDEPKATLEKVLIAQFEDALKGTAGATRQGAETKIRLEAYDDPLRILVKILYQPSKGADTDRMMIAGYLFCSEYARARDKFVPGNKVYIEGMNLTRRESDEQQRGWGVIVERNQMPPIATEWLALKGVKSADELEWVSPFGVEEPLLWRKADLERKTERAQILSTQDDYSDLWV